MIVNRKKMIVNTMNIMKDADSEEEEMNVKDFNLIFSALTGGGRGSERRRNAATKMRLDNDRHEECDSDDEKQLYA